MEASASESAARAAAEEGILDKLRAAECEALRKLGVLEADAAALSRAEFAARTSSTALESEVTALRSDADAARAYVHADTEAHAALVGALEAKVAALTHERGAAAREEGTADAAAAQRDALRSELEEARAESAAARAAAAAATRKGAKELRRVQKKLVASVALLGGSKEEAAEGAAVVHKLKSDVQRHAVLQTNLMKKLEVRVPRARRAASSPTSS